MDNNNNNDILFFKIFKNIFLKSKIFKYLKIYNNYTKQIIFIDYLSKNENIKFNLEYRLKNHLHKDFIKTIQISVNQNNISQVIDFISSNQLPINIETVVLILSPGSKAFSYQLPTNFQQSTIKELIVCPGINITINEFNCLPSTLNKLSIHDIFNHPFRLSNSSTIFSSVLALTSLELSHFGDSIQPYSLPQTLESLNITFISAPIGSTKPPPLEANSLPESITNLTLSLPHGQNISNGIIPRNVKYLKLYYKDYQKIHPNDLPPTLLQLTINNNLNFTGLFEIGSLPNSIESFEFTGRLDQPLTKELLPSNLKKFYFLPDFKTSSVRRDSEIINEKKSYGFEISDLILPHSITNLKLAADLKIGSLVNNNQIIRFKGSINNTNLYSLPTSIKRISLLNSILYPINSTKLFKHLFNLEAINFGDLKDFSIDLDSKPKQLQTIKMNSINNNFRFSNYFNNSSNNNINNNSNIKTIKFNKYENMNEQYDFSRIQSTLENLQLKLKSDNNYPTNFFSGFQQLKVLSLYQYPITQLYELPKTLVFLEVNHLAVPFLKAENPNKQIYHKINSTSVPFPFLKYLVFYHYVPFENPLPKSLETVYICFSGHYDQDNFIKLSTDYPDLIKILNGNKQFYKYLNKIKSNIINPN